MLETCDVEVSDLPTVFLTKITNYALAIAMLYE